MNKKLVSVAVTGIALSLGLCGCTKQSAEPGASAEAQPLSAISVALVAGGAHPYFQPWKQAGTDAAAAFGIGKVTFDETSEWDQTKQNSAINALAAQGYTAFGVTGVSSTDINTTFAGLKQDKFAAGALGACPSGENSADFCLATDVKTAAYTAAQTTIKAMGGKGNLVHLTGGATDGNTQARIKGVEQAVTETNGAVTLLTTVTDIDKDLQSAQKAVSDLLAAKGKDIQGIVTTAGNPAVAATQGVTESGLPIKVIATDDDPIVVRAVAAGDIAGTVVQNPYGQAYVGAWAVANLKAGICTVKQPGVIVDSGSFVVTKDNAATYNDERMAKTKELLTQFQTTIFTCKQS